jgi:hypothetical protein
MLNKLKEATPLGAAVKLRGVIVAREEGQQVLVPRPVTPIVTPVENAEGEPRIIIETPDPKSAAKTGGATGGAVPKPPRVRIKMPGERSSGDGTSATSTPTSTVAAPKTGEQCELSSGADIFSVLSKEVDASGKEKPEGK